MPNAEVMAIIKVVYDADTALWPVYYLFDGNEKLYHYYESNRPWAAMVLQPLDTIKMIKTEGQISEL